MSHPNDGIGAYFDHFGELPRITPQQEQELGKAIMDGLTAQALLDQDPKHPDARRLQRQVRDGKRAQEQFVQANIRLVLMTARRYGWANLDLDDLVQEGIIGLMHAVEKFDYTKGFKFSTYAMWWIKQHIGKAITRTGRTIRMPDGLDGDFRRLLGIKEEYLAEKGREATTEDLAKETGMKPADVEKLMASNEDILSLDYEIDIQGNGKKKLTTAGTLSDDSADIEELLLGSDPHLEALQRALGKLSSVQQDIMYLRHKEGLTQKATGEKLGIPLNTVRRYEKEARQRVLELVLN